MQIHNRPEEVAKRRNLRRNAPPAEVILWEKLRGAQVGQAKFRRQYSTGPFVLDFYCPEVRLAIELDGTTHEGDEAEAYDRRRQAFIEMYGTSFLRFSNEQVRSQLNAVVETIFLKVEELRRLRSG